MRNLTTFLLLLATILPFVADANTAPCLSCADPTGLAVNNATGTTATLTWNTVPGATKYNVEVENASNNPTFFQVIATVTANTYTVSGLLADKNYKFKVRARCGGDKSDWTEWVFFNSNANGGGSNTCAVPAGLSISIDSTGAKLSWTSVPGASSYGIEIENGSGNPNFLHLVDSTLSNSYLATGLLAGLGYKFKVRSNCAGGHSDWSAWATFTANSFVPDSGPVSSSASRNGNPVLTVQIMPNPVQGEAMLRLTGASEEENTLLQLFDLSGRAVRQWIADSEFGYSEQTESFSELQNGIYILRAQNGARTSSLKLVVSH